MVASIGRAIRKTARRRSQVIHASTRDLSKEKRARATGTAHWTEELSSTMPWSPDRFRQAIRSIATIWLRWTGIKRTGSRWPSISLIDQLQKYSAFPSNTYVLMSIGPHGENVDDGDFPWPAFLLNGQSGYTADFRLTQPAKRQRAALHGRWRFGGRKGQLRPRFSQRRGSLPIKLRLQSGMSHLLQRELHTDHEHAVLAAVFIVRRSPLSFPASRRRRPGIQSFVRVAPGSSLSRG